MENSLGTKKQDRIGESGFLVKSGAALLAVGMLAIGGKKGYDDKIDGQANEIKARAEENKQAVCGTLRVIKPNEVRHTFSQKKRAYEKQIVIRLLVDSLKKRGI